MDRLVIGDVGYGKTEVALRAAAVAALSGRQVALAAPTTVLARQHLDSFARRFDNTDIVVAGLSRLSTPAEKRRVKAGLADGSTEVALIRPPVDLPEHRTLILDSESWVACLPRDHRLADRAEVEIAELLDDPIVCAPMTAGSWRDYWLAMDAREGRPPTIAGVAATYAEGEADPAVLAEEVRRTARLLTARFGGALARAAVPPPA